MSAPKLEALQPLTLDDGEHDGSFFLLLQSYCQKHHDRTDLDVARRFDLRWS